MKIMFELETNQDGTGEKITNFRVAEAVFNLCESEHYSCGGLNAEAVAKMMLLQIGKEMVGDE